MLDVHINSGLAKMLFSERRENMYQWLLPQQERVCAHIPTCTCSVTRPYATLCNPLECGPPGSSVYGISQTRILQRVAVSYSRGSSLPRDRTCVSCVSCISRQILYHWAVWEAPNRNMHNAKLPLERSLPIKSNTSGCTLRTTSTEKLAFVEAKKKFLPILSLCETPLHLHFIYLESFLSPVFTWNNCFTG